MDLRRVTTINYRVVGGKSCAFRLICGSGVQNYRIRREKSYVDLRQRQRVKKLCICKFNTPEMKVNVPTVSARILKLGVQNLYR